MVQLVDKSYRSCFESMWVKEWYSNFATIVAKKRYMPLRYLYTKLEGFCVMLLENTYHWLVHSTMSFMSFLMIDAIYSKTEFVL